jgi:hypothetical protein
MWIVSWMMESSVGCDGCRYENGKRHSRAESPVRRYQYDAQTKTEPAGSWKPVARRDERMGDGYKAQRRQRQRRESGDCGDRQVMAAVEAQPGSRAERD